MPSNHQYNEIPQPNNPAHLSRGYGKASHMNQSQVEPAVTGTADLVQGAPTDNSLLLQSTRQPQQTHLNEDMDSMRPDSSFAEAGNRVGPHRSELATPQSNAITPSRGGTLKKKRSLSKKASVKRSSSRPSSRAGSVRSFAIGEREQHSGGAEDEMESAFFTPVPTSGNPTEILANRFQAWRKVLKDLITYFRDIQKSYENRSKSLLSVSNLINNTSAPPMFLTEGGISDATHILRDFHKQVLAEGNKAKTIEDDVILQLTGLRSDLQQKIKEIKGLSGDFKNSVDKETEGTRRAVRGYQEALGLVDTQSNAASGRGDPFIIKLGVDRQLERQIEEENYLHRAFLNLESSGRELESIVIGEIQKAYSAYAGIIKREADEAYESAEKLKNGPITMAKDHEWNSFVENNEHFVDPRYPVRHVENIHYPGKDDPAASEVKAGMLERKSKYLKSYTPGWYVLSPTHIHEFKSPDRITSQVPLMSLYLPEQKLGSHSSPDSSSHKFMLKGRQSGGMHRGHAWVFRAESHDTMLAWYEDIKNLTEKTGAERKAFVRQHARSVSGGSQKPGSISSEGALDEDEADEVPYSGAASQVDQKQPQEEKLVERPHPGGRFPSALNVDRDSQVPLSPSSGTSSGDREIIAAGAALPGSGAPVGQPKDHVQTAGDEVYANRDSGQPPRTTLYRDDHNPAAQVQEFNNLPTQHGPYPVMSHGSEYNTQPVQSQGISSDAPGTVSYGAPPSQQQQAPIPLLQQLDRPHSAYGDWMGPAAAGAVGAGVGVASVEAYRHKQQQNQPQDPAPPIGAIGTNVERAESTTSAKEPPASEVSQGGSLSTVPTSIGNITEEPSPVKTTSGIIGFGQSGHETQARPHFQSHASVVTISDLHVPGEYPRTPATTTGGGM